MILSAILCVILVLVFPLCHKKLYDILDLEPLEDSPLSVYYLDSTLNKPVRKIDDVLIMVNGNYVPVDFIVMDIECKLSFPIVLGRPFLRTVGVVIDMKEGNIKFQFPLRKGMEHFPRRRMKHPFDTIVRASYNVDVFGLDNT